MEILSLNNRHIKKDTANLGYGCLCPYCYTAFIFDSKDIDKPRTPFYNLKDCKVTCPNTNCQRILPMDHKCIRVFENSDEKDKFRSWFEVRGRINK